MDNNQDSVNEQDSAGSPQEAPLNDDLRDKLQRSQAELINLERRLTGQILQAKERGRIETVLCLLPLYDHLERAFSHLTDEAKAEAAESVALQQWLDGIKGLPAEMERQLTALGVEKITSTGEPFSPDKHEAVSQETDGTQPDGVVLKTIKTGWQTKEGHLVRPASVVVNNNLPNAARDSSEMPSGISSE